MMQIFMARLRNGKGFSVLCPSLLARALLRPSRCSGARSRAVNLVRLPATEVAGYWQAPLRGLKDPHLPKAGRCGAPVYRGDAEARRITKVRVPSKAIGNAITFATNFAFFAKRNDQPQQAK